MRLATCRFYSFHPRMGVPVAVTLSRPKQRLWYQVLDEVGELKPWGLFHVNDRPEFERRYRERLDQVGVDRIRKRLRRIAEKYSGRPLVLLCYESVDGPDEWCHRRTFAEWWEDRTGEPVPEVGGDRPLPWPDVDVVERVPWLALEAKELKTRPGVFHGYVGHRHPERACGHDHTELEIATVCAEQLAARLNESESR
jgi:hypothetical protein